MMRNPRQGQSIRIVSPIPPEHLAEASMLWWRGFGLRGIRRSHRPVRAENGVIALDDQNCLRGVMGIRNGSGGFLRHPPRRARLFYRGAPATEDLVIDGILALECRKGIGAALLGESFARARQEGRPGIRVEVQARNRAALAFYLRQGFVEIIRGRFAWPWSGTVIVLRLPVQAPV
jgi:GNAT superfamily N-acetyltransferase